MDKSRDSCDDDRLNELNRLVLQFAQDRDWLQFHTPKNLSMAIAAEAAELMEHFLWDEGSRSLEKVKSAAHRDSIEQELADVLILTIQFANVAGFDLEKIVRDKIALNENTYPVDRARGNARKYTDL